MTLTTHAITGAAIASSMPSHPVLGFAAGFASHFLLDAIPHWDLSYLLKSTKKNSDGSTLDIDMNLNKKFLQDLLMVGVDGLIGLILVYIIFLFYGKISIIALLCGATGGVMPDFLAFVQMKFRHEPFTSLLRFHLWIHSKIKMDGQFFLGISLQIIFIILVVSVFKFVF